MLEPQQEMSHANLLAHRVVVGHHPDKASQQSRSVALKLVGVKRSRVRRAGRKRVRKTSYGRPRPRAWGCLGQLAKAFSRTRESVLECPRRTSGFCVTVVKNHRELFCRTEKNCSIERLCTVLRKHGKRVESTETPSRKCSKSFKNIPAATPVSNCTFGRRTALGGHTRGTIGPGTAPV